MKSKNIFKNFVGELYSHSKVKSLAIIGLMILLSFMQGIGLLMLVPLLGMIGLDTGYGTSNVIASRLNEVFGLIGLKITLPVILISYFIIISAHSSLKYYLEIINARLELGFVKRLRNSLYEKLTFSSWLFFTRTKASDITHILTTELQRIGVATHYVLRMISTFVIVFIYILFAFSISAWMSFLVAGLGIFFFIVFKHQNYLAQVSGSASYCTMRNMYSIIMENLSGMKTVKSYGSEEAQLERFSEINNGIEIGHFCLRKARSKTQMLYSFLSALFFCIIFYFAISVVKIQIAPLILLLFVFSRAIPQILSIQQTYQQIINLIPAFDAYKKLEKKAVAAVEPAPQEKNFIKIKKEIRFSDVEFRYDENYDLNALHSINLNLSANKTYALVGVSGAGKSTFADILIGLLSPSLGSLFIDERKLADDMLYHWRSSVAYVPQETFLFNDTIKNNLKWVRKDITEGEMIKALSLASALSFVEKLPQGFDTIIGDRGVKLSGGERQRIAIARAVLKNPSLLVLDEATSSLDTENERQIQKAIENLHGNLTILIIAHRLSTIRNTDHIIVLDKGRIVQNGTWEELYQEKKGRFYTLYSHNLFEKGDVA